MGQHQVGGWEFDPASGELSRGGERRRLEPRAARTLELLCEADGAVVPHERIIAEVWNGRTLSDNSLSVVIGQLRRSLGDDARRPGLIETVPKRGYRLVEGERDSQESPPRRRRWVLVAAMMAALLAGLAVALTGRAAEPQVLVRDVVNQTGSAAYDPLARATSELIVTQLTRRGFQVRRDAAPGALTLSSRLVLWNGRPSLSLTATGDDGVVRWSGMTNGTAAQIPAGVAAELAAFERTMAAE